jgi:transcriptional regulator with PAS, ATPase and Fis domain
MDNPLVLILNPLNLPLKYLIIESINNLETITYKSIDSSECDYNQISPSPSLVLVLLGNHCDGENLEKWKLAELQNAFPLVPIYCVVDTSSINRLDCHDYAWGIIHTPIKKEDIQFIIHWHIKSATEDSGKSIKRYIKKRSILDLFVGESPAAVNLKNKISSVAPLDITILLQGETGTGKELAAKLIHHLSDRAGEPFIAVNCGAIPNELFENELFGHKKGAFTHADSTERGLIHAAEGGTLFLDEIESMPISSQVKLLRFIEDKQYKPLGQSSTIISDVRIIAAANQELIKLIDKGDFREDLFYRLSVVSIIIPPLRDRKEDIPLLSKHFVDRFSKIFSKDIKGIRLMKLKKK